MVGHQPPPGRSAIGAGPTLAAFQIPGDRPFVPVLLRPHRAGVGDPVPVFAVVAAVPQLLACAAGQAKMALSLHRLVSSFLWLKIEEPAPEEDLEDAHLP